MKIIFRTAIWIFVSTVLIYTGLLLFPQVLFNKPIDYKSFKIYSHQKIDQKIFSIIDSSEALLNKSEFFNKSSLKQKVFLCSGFNEFSFWGFGSRKAFAVNQKLANNIFVAHPDIAGNLAMRNSNDYNTRSLSGVIAHETTHSLLRKALKGTKLKTWINEGYCDFIANESSFPFEKGMNNLCNDLPEESGSFSYFKYRIYISYLIREEHLTLSQIAGIDYSLKELDKKIKNKYCR